MFLNENNSEVNAQSILEDGQTITIMPFCSLPDSSTWPTKPGDAASPLAVNWLRISILHFEMSFHFEVL